MQNERNLRAGGLDPFQNPKPASFIENLTGNEDPRLLATSAEVERRLPDRVGQPTGAIPADPGGADPSPGTTLPSLGVYSYSNS